MRHEAWVLNVEKSDDQCPVPSTFLSGMAAARACAQEMLIDESLGCLADMQRLLKNSTNLLLSMDRSFKFELEWIESGADEAFVDRVRADILTCMPSQAAVVTLTQSCQKLDDLLQSEKVKFASLRCQSEIKTVRKLLDKMITGVTPDVSVQSGGPVFEAVWRRLQWYASAEVPGEATSRRAKKSLNP